jgi:hypothetical protein
MNDNWGNYLPVNKQSAARVFYPPQHPDNLHASRVTRNSATLTWDNATSGRAASALELLMSSGPSEAFKMVAKLDSAQSSF